MTFCSKSIYDANVKFKCVLPLHKSERCIGEDEVPKGVFFCGDLGCALDGLPAYQEEDVPPLVVP